MLLPRGRRTFPLSRPFSALPAGLADLYLPDPSGFVAGFFGRHLAVRSPYGMGRLDCLGCYHHHRRERCCHLCYEADPGQ